MSPDEPGVAEPHEPGTGPVVSTATFGAGVEPAEPDEPPAGDARRPTADEPASSSPREPVHGRNDEAPPPDGSLPRAEPDPEPLPSDAVGPDAAMRASEVSSRSAEPESRRPDEVAQPVDAEPSDATDAVAPAAVVPVAGGGPVTADGDLPKVRPPTARRRLLDDPDPDAPRAPRRAKVRARKVHRIVRHVEPWSVLKISVLFFLSLFLIICVASAVLWNAARSAGAIDDVESFVTSLGFGNCEDLPGQDTSTSPATTPSTIDGGADQLGGTGGSTTTLVPATEPDDTSTLPDEDGKCAEGQRLVGGFKFEDQRIFQAFGLGGVVLVLAGAAASVVMALLFNLISDLTGGMRVTVLEEEPRRPRSGSPARSGRD